MTLWMGSAGRPGYLSYVSLWDLAGGFHSLDPEVPCHRKDTRNTHNITSSVNFYLRAQPAPSQELPSVTKRVFSIRYLENTEASKASL